MLLGLCLLHMERYRVQIVHRMFCVKHCELSTNLLSHNLQPTANFIFSALGTTLNCWRDQTRSRRLLCLLSRSACILQQSQLLQGGFVMADCSSAVSRRFSVVCTKF